MPLTFPRRFPMAIAVCLGITISTLGLLATCGHFAREAEVEFQALAAERSLILGKAIDRNLAILRSINGLYAASSEVERDEFHLFVEQIISQVSGIQALEWIPRIPAAERAAYEELARAEGYPDFRISEQDPGGEMVPAANREEYFPVYFLEPYQGNERALGFDLGSNATRLEALNLARDTGRLTATAGVRLVQETTSQPGFLAFAPIYESGATPEAVERRRTDLAGFALGVFRIGLAIAAGSPSATAAASLPKAGPMRAPHSLSSCRRNPNSLESAQNERTCATDQDPRGRRRSR